MILKVLFFILGLIASSQQNVSEEAMKAYMVYHGACLKETGVDEGETVRALKGDISDDPLLKQYFFCVSRKAGFQDENGKYQLDVLRQKLSNEMNSEELEMLIEKCLMQENDKDNPIEITYDAVLCYRDNHQSGFHIERAGGSA